MIVKKIEIEMVFPDDFIPPEKYYEENNQCHGDCPFWMEDFECGGWCKIAADGEECPLKKYFSTETEEETPSEPIVSKEVWDEAQKIIPREELCKAVEESILRAEKEYYMKVMREALNITKQKRRKENEELFKQALIDGVNNRFQREIDSCTDYTPPDEKQRMEKKLKILKACAAVRPDIKKR